MGGGKSTPSHPTPKARPAASVIAAIMTAKPSLSVVFAIVLLSARALSASPPDTQSAAAAIDAILARDWAKHQLQGNADADDHTWVRRVYLDIIGRIPNYEEASPLPFIRAARTRTS